MTALRGFSQNHDRSLVTECSYHTSVSISNLKITSFWCSVNWILISLYFLIYMSFLNKLPHKSLITGLSLAVLQGLPRFLISDRHKNWTGVSSKTLYPAVFSDSFLCPQLQSQQRNGCDHFNFTNSSSTQNSSAYTEILLLRLHWCEERGLLAGGSRFLQQCSKFRGGGLQSDDNWKL